MDCPQCGGTFATYALGGREASVCEDCGYVGIAAEHRGDPRRVESWNDALRRFYRAHDTDAEPGVELRPPLSRPSESDGESWEDALQRFYARRTAGEPEPDTSAGEQSEADAEDSAADDSAVDGSSEKATGSDDSADGTTTPPQSSAGDS
jgi:hypothetical protein